MKYDPLYYTNESNLLGELYHHCKLKKIKCVLEYALYPIKCKATKHDKFYKIDAIIVYENQILALIEAKSTLFKNKKEIYNSYQVRKYRLFKLPIFILNELKDIKRIIDKIKILILLKENPSYHKENKLLELLGSIWE